MIPFLKRKEEVPPRDEDATAIGRKPDYEDDGDGDPMLDAIADDMLSAMAKKDKGLMKESLGALCEYLRDELADFDDSDNEINP